MTLKHRLLVFALIGPALSFAVMTAEVALIALVGAATGLGPPVPHLWASVMHVAHNATSPVFVMLFALFAAPAALAGLAVDLAERYERAEPAMAIAAGCTAVTLMAILPGFFTVLVYANTIGGVLAGLVAGVAASLGCWLITPARAQPEADAAPTAPRKVVIDPYAYRPGQDVGAFGRR